MQARSAKTVPFIQYFLFTLLVIATPFVVVTKFLQGAFYDISHASLSLLGFHLPVLATVAVLTFVVFLVWQRRNINPRRLGGALLVAGMIALAHWVQDFYSGLAVFDLQMNWHYVAYAAYVYMFFRAFNRRRSNPAGMIYLAFLSAVCLSTVDEFFQFNLSNRVFDVSDIAKDSWGAVIGLVLMFFVSETYGTIDFKHRSVRHGSLQGYMCDPLAAMFMTGLFSLALILLSPLLTEHEYIGIVALLSIGCFLLLAVIIHLTKFRIARVAIIGVGGLLVAYLGWNLIFSNSAIICQTSGGMALYRGIPIPFLDVMVFPNGMPRLVDKKRLFNRQDQKMLLSLEPDILLIGSGQEGKGGKGFNVQSGTTFIYNQNKRAGTQVIILRTSEACSAFNRLNREGKKVLFVLHNS